MRMESSQGKGRLAGQQSLGQRRASWKLPRDHPNGVDLGQYTAAQP